MHSSCPGSGGRCRGGRDDEDRGSRFAPRYRLVYVNDVVVIRPRGPPQYVHHNTLPTRSQVYWNQLEEGDIDPDPRQMMQDVPIALGSYAAGLTGYRAYPTADGLTKMFWPHENSTNYTRPFEMMTLERSCPPVMTNTNAKADFFWEAEVCGNNHPVSPKCRGQSCGFLQVAGSGSGLFFITRKRNGGMGDNKGPQNYTANEEAELWFPRPGKIVVHNMDVEHPGDSLALYDFFFFFPGPLFLGGSFFFRSLLHIELRTLPLVQTSTRNQLAVPPISKTISSVFSYGVTKLLFLNVLSSGHRV